MQNKRYILPLLATLCVIGLLVIPPIPQDPLYHNFVDERTIFGVPNFFNVITNLPFAIVGILGLSVIRTSSDVKLRKIGLIIFLGFMLLTLGSGYYHLWPNNRTLVYDRLPIVSIIMSFFAFIIYDRVKRKAGYNAFIFLNVLGILSVLYWSYTQQAGKGDLRWYALVQFFPIIAIPLILILYKSPSNSAKQVVPMLIFFALAKFAEMLDESIYRGLGNTISGHSLKHILMALAGYEIVVLMRRRIQIK